MSRTKANRIASRGNTHNRSSLSNENFVVLWQSAPNMRAVEKGYDLGVKAAQQRATNLRKRGVKLKRFSRGKTDINVEKLNGIAKKALAKLKS